MIKPSLKSMKRMAKRLHRHGVHLSVVAGEPYFMEPVKMRLSHRCGVSFVIDTELPICPFPENGHYSLPIAGRVNRLSRAYHLAKMQRGAALNTKVLQDKAMEASGELVEFLNHIRNPRVSFSS